MNVSMKGRGGERKNCDLAQLAGVRSLCGSPPKTDLDVGNFAPESAQIQAGEIRRRVFDDPTYKEDKKAEGKDPRLEMNNLVADTFTTFTELSQLMKRFPDKEKWSHGNLPTLRAEMIAEIEDKTAGIGRSPKEDKKAGSESNRRTVKLAEHEQMKSDYEHRILMLEQENRLLRDQISKLSDAMARIPVPRAK